MGKKRICLKTYFEGKCSQPGSFKLLAQFDHQRAVRPGPCFCSRHREANLESPACPEQTNSLAPPQMSLCMWKWDVWMFGSMKTIDGFTGTKKFA